MWDTVNARHKDIDGTIQQIDYISQMQNEEVYDEMLTIVKGIALKKDLLDQLQIAISEEDFGKYLRLYSFPARIRRAINVKFLELQEEQKRIGLRIKD